MTRTAADSQLPQHAIDEIEAAQGAEKDELATFWNGWLSIGDAKGRFRAAVLALVDAEYAFAACRSELSKLEQRPVGPRECLCGKHAAAIDAAHGEREAARTGIDVAIAEHKGA